MEAENSNDERIARDQMPDFLFRFEHTVLTFLLCIFSAFLRERNFRVKIWINYESSVIMYICKWNSQKLPTH